MYYYNRSSVSSYGGFSNTVPSCRRSFNRFSGSNFSFVESIEPVSLAVNYVPSKLSEFRIGTYDDDDPHSPKTDGISQGKGMPRWNRFKWILFSTNTLVCFLNPFKFLLLLSQIIQLALCSMSAFIVCLLTWFDVWEKGVVIRTGNAPELILSTLAALIAMLTSLIGCTGILLNNRTLLAWYTFLTWITFIPLVAPGYITYKRRTFDLEGKINAQWSRNLNTADRLLIQNQLNCCGYFSPYVEATVSQTCYARSLLPGCKGPYLAFERNLLRIWFKAVFSLVPVQILVMVSGLLCSNHITYRFGKGMMPEAYQLNMQTIVTIMNNYAK